MNRIYSITLALLLTASAHAENPHGDTPFGFTENRGQVINQHGSACEDVRYLLSGIRGMNV